MLHRYVNIAVPPLEQLFTYELPDDAPDLYLGCGLQVSFGRQHRFGYIIEETFPKDEATLEKIKHLNLDQEIYHCFLPEQLPFFKWIANYYGVPLSQTIETAIPKPTPAKQERFITYVKEPDLPLKGKKQIELFEKIKSSSIPLSYTQLNKDYKNVSATLYTLEAKGLIKIETKKTSPKISSTSAPNWAKRRVELNTDQTKALEEIKTALFSKSFTPFLLHGVTGSGKTEVYIEAINIARAQGLGSLVIVPEIALTPQLTDRFTARLGTDIAILHSAISNRDRWNAWSALLSGQSQIAIGARSGIFAPIKNLGLIIVDEEHDGSYKQSDSLRYNARDLAVVLGTMHHCPVILGSATPSLETYYNALNKKYHYIPLKKRHDSGSDISIEIVDMNKNKKTDLPSPNISNTLYQALKDTLDHHQQAFILYNRRGFACYLQCPKCNTVMTCPNCSVTLTYHATDNSLKCHYCDYKITAPKLCPHCKEEEKGELILRGSGTEKVYDEIAALFPTAKLARLDRDSAENTTQYRKILDDVRNKKTDILIGTQMIAKGHDLPDVTLVGIVDCDVGLHLPDFRASERVFQLLTQAGGRAGRGATQGRVFLQTRVPNHLSLKATESKSFAAFAKRELANRKDLNYPPFSRILRILVSSENSQDLPTLMTQLRNYSEKIIEQQNLEALILGPCPTVISKIRNRWRWHLLFKAKSPGTLNIIMHALQPITQKFKAPIRVAYDMDPQDLL